MAIPEIPQRPDIPDNLRVVKPARPGALVQTIGLPRYFVFEHVIKTVGLAGIAEILGWPGDIIDSKGNVRVPAGKVRAEFVYPFMNDGKRITSDELWSRVNAIEDDLNSTEGQGRWEGYPQELVRQYHSAREQS